MSTPIYRYPLDPTGVNPDNLVVREPKELIPKPTQADVRVTAPLYGPFFADSLVILDAANGRALGKNEYQVTDLLSNPTLTFGKEISQFIVITNGAVSNNIEISYQVLGGNYQNDSTSVQHVFETFLNDTRPVDWSNIAGKPGTFPPSLHVHLLEDIVNFGPLIVSIDSLRQAMLLNNTPMFEALIDFILTREINWTAITNKPTTIQGFGITNGVTTNTTQTITGEKTFGVVHLGTNSTGANPDMAGRSRVATDGQVQRAENRLVPKTRQILTEDRTGLLGGGDLHNDLQLELSDSGVIPDTYGSTVRVPTFTVDRYGRITEASDVEPNLSWDRITDLPTTAEGFGITDVVTTHSDQRIEGVKSFKHVNLDLGSLAANFFDEKFSRVVSEDSLQRLMDEALKGESSGPGDDATFTLRFGKFILMSGIRPANASWVNLPIALRAAMVIGPGITNTTFHSGGAEGQDYSVLTGSGPALGFRVWSPYYGRWEYGSMAAPGSPMKLPGGQFTILNQGAGLRVAAASTGLSLPYFNSSYAGNYGTSGAIFRIMPQSQRGGEGHGSTSTVYYRARWFVIGIESDATHNP